MQSVHHVSFKHCNLSVTGPCLQSLQHNYLHANELEIVLLRSVATQLRIQVRDKMECGGSHKICS